MADSLQRLFVYARLRATCGGGWRPLNERVSIVLSQWPNAVKVGLFMGLFGMSNQELIVLLSLPKVMGEGSNPITEMRARLPADVEMVEAMGLRSTIRPQTDAPLNRSGIYIFRFYDVLSQDVDEIVGLSGDTWKDWEGDKAYPGEPMGLFRLVEPKAESERMLLLTWYENMASWEGSRSSHISVSANLRRREALSQSIIAYVTRSTESEIHKRATA